MTRILVTRISDHYSRVYLVIVDCDSLPDHDHECVLAPRSSPRRSGSSSFAPQSTRLACIRGG